MLKSELPTGFEVKQWLKKGFPLVRMETSLISLETWLPNGNDKIRITSWMHDMDPRTIRKYKGQIGNINVFLLQGEEFEKESFLFPLSMIIKRSGIFLRDGDSLEVSRLDPSKLDPDQLFILELSYKMMSLVYMNEADPDYFFNIINEITKGKIVEERYPMLDVYPAEEVNEWLRANLNVLGNYLKKANLPKR